MIDTSVGRERLRSGLQVHFGEMAVKGLKDEDLDEILQDLESTMFVGPSEDPSPAPMNGDSRDGVLVLTFDYKEKAVIPKVERLGIMTEARLEMALGSVYAEINRARVQEYKRMETRLQRESSNR